MGEGGNAFYRSRLDYPYCPMAWKQLHGTIFLRGKSPLFFSALELCQDCPGKPKTEPGAVPLRRICSGRQLSTTNFSSIMTNFAACKGVQRVALWPRTNVRHRVSDVCLLGRHLPGRQLSFKFCHHTIVATNKNEANFGR